MQGTERLRQSMACVPEDLSETALVKIADIRVVMV